MITGRNIVQLIIFCFLLGTITFFVKRYLDLDIKPYAFGFLMGYIAVLIIRNRKSNKT